MIRLSEPCLPRPIRFLDLWESAGWRLKVYGIAHGRAMPRPELVASARRLAQDQLPLPAITANRYGAGFVGIHDGRGANFVFLCWWSQENELHHRVYCSPSDQPDRLIEQAPDGAKACVWDLAVLCFERQAWLDAVLRNPAGPDLDQYFSTRLNADV